MCKNDRIIRVRELKVFFYVYLDGKKDKNFKRNRLKRNNF